MLRYGSFDPTVTQPEVPLALRSTPAQRLQVVQFVGTPTQAGRDMIAALGGEIVSYLPQDSYVVRIERSGAAGLRRAPSVRWVGAYHPAYRLDPALIDGGALQQQAPRKFDVVVANKRTDKPRWPAGCRRSAASSRTCKRGGC